MPLDTTKKNIDKKLLLNLKKYIEENFDENDKAPDKVYLDTNILRASVRGVIAFPPNLFKEIESSFSEYLLLLIKEKRMNEREVYKNANVDRRVFSKIKSKPDYKPSKTTAVAFAIALKLDMTETRRLVEKAGYSITYNNKFDIIIEYFITNKIYDVFEINEALFEFGQPLLGNGNSDL